MYYCIFWQQGLFLLNVRMGEQESDPKEIRQLGTANSVSVQMTMC
jgi:hypothetical protein